MKKLYIIPLFLFILVNVSFADFVQSNTNESGSVIATVEYVDKQVFNATAIMLTIEQVGDDWQTITDVIDNVHTIRLGEGIELYNISTNVVGIALSASSGSTLDAPTNNLYDGKLYFDTTLGHPMWYSTTITNWVNASGAVE